MLNRHGLIAGATGTGKTVTLKVIAESLSQAGVPVFLADVKGDLASLAAAGSENDKMLQRKAKFGLTDDIFPYQAFPTQFWDFYGEQGLPIRITVSEMGPVMMARILGLNDVQEGVLSIVFRVADERGLLLLDLKDLRAMLNEVGEHASDLQFKYGNISPNTVGAIARNLLLLEDAGGNMFFGEPALNLADFMQISPGGLGCINVLDARRLFMNPLLYSTFLLWLMSELFEVLPEVGDLPKPKLVFFFDEAHLLFDEMPKALLQKVEQVIKLIRSKGVGIFFITQNPADVPGSILAQLGNKVQHALRAYTPAEQKGIKAAADSFRVNPSFNTAQVLTELATGEALVSVLDSEGRPTVVERCFILPPQSQFGSLDANLRQQIMAASPFYLKYAQSLDRESAYEFLTAKYKEESESQEAEKRRQAEAQRQIASEKEETKKRELYEKERIRAEKAAETERLRLEREAEKRAREEERRAKEEERRRSNSMLTKMTNSAVSTIGRELGRGLFRGLLGGFKR